MRLKYVDYAEYSEKQVTINGNTASLFIAPSEDNTDGIVWTDPDTNTLFFVSGHFDQETFIKIAENVKEKK